MIPSKFLIVLYIVQVLTPLMQDKSFEAISLCSAWIPLGIHLYANLTVVFFTRMEQDPEEEDITQPNVSICALIYVLSY